MAQLKFGSAGVTAREIDLSGPVSQSPVGVPAGIVGTSKKGPAFVPITVGNINDWYAKFGRTDGKKFGPLAVLEWLRNAQAVTYLKVLGVGTGRMRNNDGTVTSAGFTVGDQLFDENGYKSGNIYANTAGDPGRTYFLGCFMSESAGSTIFSDAGLQGPGSVTPGSSTALPIVRGVLMAPSGVYLTLSASMQTIDSSKPLKTDIGSTGSYKGFAVGDVVLSSNGVPKQDFTLLLNGHKGTNPTYPNIITASFDVRSNNYIAKSLNTDPYKIQEAGHYLYAHWDIHPVLAAVTGTGLVAAAYGAGGTKHAGIETAAFVLHSGEDRGTGTDSVPNYESFTDRFGHAKTPWIVSQKFGGRAQELFRLHSLDDGAGVSTSVKVSIENITPSTDPLNRFGSFNVVLRVWSDRDLDKKVVSNETFSGVNLDPSSDRYIGKVIGDVHAYYDFDREESEQKLVIEGNYENRSSYVRVEVHPDIVNGFVDPTAIPMGFRGIDHLVTSGSSPLESVATAHGTLSVSNATRRAVTPPLPFRTRITTGTEDTNMEQLEPSFYWGVQFEHPETLASKNTSVLPNSGLTSYAKYFPDFAVGTAKFVTGSNAGDPDTVNLGIVDADRFCNNFFTLENLQVVTGSNGLANPDKWLSARYLRNGKVTVSDPDKTRAFTTDDLLSNKRFAKFTLFMQGGFDGVNIFDEDSAELLNPAVTAEMDSASDRGLAEGPTVRTYLKAIEVMQNTTNVDIQLFAIPGIREPIVTDAATLAVEDRFDAMYVMDIEEKDDSNTNVVLDTQVPSVTNTINTFIDRSVNSSFAAAYFPDVLYSDPTGANLFVPPSVLVLGALSLNDSVGHPWFAPAGFTRGALPDAALEPRVRLNQADMDKLYDNKINPLVAFPGATRGGTNPRSGIVVWGQKTLQVAASALDRVNVRRLLIEIRRQVRDIAQTILFEPNREATLARFSSAVTPRLQRIQALSGLERFKVIIDSSTTTQDDILNNTIRGKIYVQPTKSIEFVSLDFVVANNIQQ